MINWAMISLAHIKFRRAKQQQGVTTRFPALLYPLGNWVCLLFMAAVLVIMLITPHGDFRLPDPGLDCDPRRGYMVKQKMPKR